ncbi:MAG TPA: polyprenyl diphosphate synthase [Amaricoccus sp.]|uniref:polyprenyl diphosphate synthase n=1 Tax=Amaricoccus sp. TaxID=1872485 RepID=UPI002BB0760A|nr:polyprenyl diphosphate synthase [Amaricoccus sp.]HMQ91987.1 polyprenyl diphosphate synthase [Amaricoccus sp.]HMR52798.1 polyprenyl diphosphate synthase [Amaricoccus sp.]HMR61653.1 polyprenyl diphosphate synthase [Amaricoccus sp.]HMT99733.1 polyprenyl diphosphate synthase [Amaricoccus sp.]
MHFRETRTFHVGIIMDGNGRWAEARGLNRVAGHARGARRVTEIVDACPGLGVTHLTIFAFSTENWRRPLVEVEALMRIFRQYIRKKIDDLEAHEVRVRFIGLRDRVPARLRQLMQDLEDRTAHCEGLNLTIAIDYGGRDEITRAVRSLARDVASGALQPGAISERGIAAALDTRELPDPDLIIRTSGEFRVSNFLLWQSTYAEYDFPTVAWPDFTAERFAESVSGYTRRLRRFGQVLPPAGMARASR